MICNVTSPESRFGAAAAGERDWKNQIDCEFLIGFRGYNEVNDRELVDDGFGILFDDGFLDFIPLGAFDEQAVD